MSGSYNEDDLLVSIRELNIAIRSLDEKIGLLIKNAISDHQSECWRCNDFITTSTLPGLIEDYNAKKRRAVIEFAEVIKAVFYIGVTVVAYGFLK